LQQLQASGDIRKNYAEFLKEFHWEYFFTSTFREPRREPYYALKHVWSEIKSCGAARSFMGVEPHQSGDLHIHGICSGFEYRVNNRTAFVGNELDLPWEIWGRLFHRFGRAKVEECNSAEAVTGYCAKYVLKGSRRADHYEIFGDKIAWQMKSG
jgi:hypothetical protein